MANTFPDWPSTSWRLSAPETYVVWHGVHASGGAAFKLGLMELVARGALVIDDSAEQRAVIGSRRVSAVHDGAQAGAPLERVLAAMWELYLQAPRLPRGAQRSVGNARADGVPSVAVADLGRAAARHYGSLQGFVAREVLPALEERGLFETRKERVLGIFPTTRHVMTPSGEAARAELEYWLEAGRARFAGSTGTDGSQALAFAGAAGAAVLLMPSVLPELRRIRAQMPGAIGSDDDLDTSSSSYVGATYSDPGDFSAGALDFGSLDLNVFDGLEAAMSAIESAFESASGGDAGSDSGSSNSDSGSGSSDSGSSSDSGGSSSDSGSSSSSDSGSSSSD